MQRGHEMHAIAAFIYNVFNRTQLALMRVFNIKV